MSLLEVLVAALALGLLGLGVYRAGQLTHDALIDVRRWLSRRRRTGGNRLDLPDDHVPRLPRIGGRW